MSTARAISAGYVVVLVVGACQATSAERDTPRRAPSRVGSVDGDRATDPAPRSEGQPIETWRALDSPTYLANDERGIHVRSVDGTLAVRLADPADDVQLDHRHDALWLRRGAELFVVDLRDGAMERLIGNAIPDAGNLPSLRTRVLRAGDPWPFSGEIPSPRSGAEFRNSRVELVLTLDDSPDLAAYLVHGEDWKLWYSGAFGGVEDRGRAMQDLEVRANGARLVDGTALATLVERTPRPEPIRYRPGTQPMRIDLPEPIRTLTRRLPRKREGDPPSGCKSNPDMCGRAVPFGRYQLVYVADACGSFCYWYCLFYDPAEDRWAVPPNAAKWMAATDVTDVGPCDTYWLHASSQQYLADIGEQQSYHVCELGDACVRHQGRPLGWIDAGPMIVVEKTHGP